MDIGDLRKAPACDGSCSIDGGATLDSGVEFQLRASKRPLTVADYKILALSALGGALEFYDFVIFVFFTFGVFAVGYFVRPLGGIASLLPACPMRHGLCNVVPSAIA